MKRWDSLDRVGWRFCYDDALFPPGTDTFLLSDFPRLRAGMQVCDLGAGTGLLGLLLLRRERRLSVTGVEVQTEAVRLAAETVAVNGLADSLQVMSGDLREIRGLLPAGRYSLVVSNPPYYPEGSGAAPREAGRRVARMETACTLEDVCRAAAYLLRWGGRFCTVCKPERLADLFCILRDCGLEGKRLQLIQTRSDAPPALALVEGRRGGRPGLTLELRDMMSTV